MAVKRTPEQEEVVKNRGGALLVSAAAGSGKTRVLVERLMDYILQEGRNIDEFLIITFTRAAAEELRARIAKEIAEALAAQPDHAHLRQQTVRLYETQISTIHAFCTVLLRQWGHLLDIPGDFALCEDEEAQVLMTRTLNQVLEARYEEIDPTGPFARLLDVLSKGRDDSRLLEITLDIYGKIQSYPDPLAWLASQREALDLSAVTDVGQTPWGSLLLEEAGQTAAYWADQMAWACDLAQKEAGLEKAYGDSLQATRRSLEAFVQAAGTSWDEAARVEIVFPKLKAARGVEDPALQEQIKSIRARCKKAVEELTQTVSGPSAPLLADMALVYPAMLGLLDLVEDFSRAYEAAKKQRSLLDFSDLEHLAVRLLVDEAGGPTPLARQWGARYTEIMVDEYQDTNQVQNTIFQALSQEGRNLFMVGDVKQSIYRFRLADPTIFLEKYRTFPPYDQAQVGQERRITLSKNFRSRPQVLEAANDLFRAIMSRRLGEMDYTDGEALYPGGTFPAGEGYETEFHVLDFTEDPAYTEEKQNRNALEARFVAKEIAELLQSGFPVSDGAGGTRPVRPDDIAILLRSPGPVRRYYTQALEEQGVGWSAEEGGDLFAASEVSVALSWLQIIDNPQQDIPLLAVLRSPLVGMTGDRLAEIRGLAEGTFYTALQAAGAQGWEDCRSFLGQLEALRFGAGEESSHHLLWSLYRQTDMLEVYSSLPGGEKRRENLLSFYELARRFEGAGHKGLFGFLLHLDRVRESGGLPAMPAAPKEEAGVKILSIHRSKGLEYSVVFLCGLGRRINYGDLQKPVLFHPRLGLGPKGLDRETMVEFTTLARTGVALALKKELLAEEGINLEIVEFTDYIQPNTAVENGSIDANYFQHITYLNNFNAENGTHLVSVADVHYEPFGIYAGKTASLEELQDGAQIGVPNDPTNGGRALLLLQEQGLITLKEDVGLEPTKLDIAENPHNYEIVEMEAAQLPRSLGSLDIAVINGNYAIQADLKVADALAIESAEGTAGTAYVNVLAVKEGRESDPAIQALAKALCSDEVKAFIDETYAGAVQAVF